MLNRSPNYGGMCSLNRRFWANPERGRAPSFWKLVIKGNIKLLFCSWHSFSECVLYIFIFYGLIMGILNVPGLVKHLRFVEFLIKVMLNLVMEPLKSVLDSTYVIFHV